MERVTGGGMLPLALASVGVLLLYRILSRLRPGAALQDAVVVITGASSGLGKGSSPTRLLLTSASRVYVHTDSQQFISMGSSEISTLFLQSVRGCSMLQVHVWSCVVETQPVCSRSSRSWLQVQQARSTRCLHWS